MAWVRGPLLAAEAVPTAERKSLVWRGFASGR